MNLVENPWIPVIDFNGKKQEISLFELFTKTFRANAADFGSIQLSSKKKSKEAILDWEEFIGALENREGHKASIIIINHIFKYRRILEQLK